MKINIYFITILFLFSGFFLHAQTTLVQENFTSYTGTLATVPAGWYFSWQGDYTTTAYSGTSGPNAYKFGVTNDTAITPSFSNADTVSFWIKGSSTDTASYLSLYETSNNINWTTISVMKPIATSGVAMKFPVSASSVRLKFIYTKSAGNVAFDDFLLTGSGASPSSGWIKIYFNHPVNTSVSSSVNAIYLNQTIDDTLIAYINRAKYSLDVAVYNYIQNANISNISTAINNAYARGVRIRWIHDGGSSNTGLSGLNSGIKTLASPTTSAYNIMHNKFMIVDAKSSNTKDPIVWTGSCNWTDQQINTDVNNVIILQDKNLALAYTTEFEEMWGDTALAPNISNSKFGPYKSDNTPHNFTIAGHPVEQYFSPSDSTNKHILNSINSAGSDLYFGVYTFTDNNDANAIKNKFQSGIYTAGIVDPNSTSFAAYATLNPVMGNMLKVYSLSGLYHSKMLIVDQCAPLSDPQVLTGSHNWTALADQKNDENTLIIHDATIANIYYQSFYQNFLDLSGSLTPCTTTGVNEISEDEINIYPNPSEGKINLSMSRSDNLKMKEIKIYNVFGERVYQQIIPSSNCQIDLSSQPSGIYFLKLKSENNSFSKKIIIAR